MDRLHNPNLKSLIRRIEASSHRRVDLRRIFNKHAAFRGGGVKKTPQRKKTPKKTKRKKTTVKKKKKTPVNLQLKDMTGKNFSKFLLKLGAKIASETAEGLDDYYVNGKAYHIEKGEISPQFLKRIKKKDLKPSEYGLGYLATVVCKENLKSSYLSGYIAGSPHRVIAAFSGRPKNLVGFLSYEIRKVAKLLTPKLFRAKDEIERLRHADPSLKEKDVILVVSSMCSSVSRLGSKLILQANELAIQHGCKLIIVNHPIDSAKGFYRKMGFESHSSIEEYFGYWFKKPDK